MLVLAWPALVPAVAVVQDSTILAARVDGPITPSSPTTS
jgi:hypothetical protein